MNGLKKFTEVLAKICEVCNWVALGFMVVLTILTFVPGDIWTSMIAQSSPSDITLNAYGYEIVAKYSAGMLDLGAVRTFSIGSFFIYGLMAMVFRNVYLIIRTTRGKTKFSQGEMPFQKDITRMIREIGIFLLVIVGIEFVFSTVASIIVGADMVETYFNFSVLMIGLLMICLSSSFEQGEALQQDVDGLV